MSDNEAAVRELVKTSVRLERLARKLTGNDPAIYMREITEEEADHAREVGAGR